MFAQVYHHYFDETRRKTKEKGWELQHTQLRSICDNILKLDAESPLYLVQLSDDLQNFTLDVKAQATILKDFIKKLTENSPAKSDKLFHNKKITSSHPDIVQVTYLGSANNMDCSTDIRIEVENLAIPQINRGNLLQPNRLQISSGLYSFYINIGNYNYEFEFHVYDKETNLEIQKRVVNLINQSDIGLFASIGQEINPTRYYIQLQSNHTGILDNKEYIFTLETNSHEKNQIALSYLGIDKIYQAPRNAVFKINDIHKTSYSNNFMLNKLYEIALYSTTDGHSSVTIGLANDTGAIYDYISKLVDHYNAMLQLTSGQISQDIKSSKFNTHFCYIAQCYERELNDLGIFQNNHQLLEIKPEILALKIESEESIGGQFLELRNFLVALSDRIDLILLNPLDYAEKKVVAYKDTEKKLLPNSYITSMYSGLLFNGYC